MRLRALIDLGFKEVDVVVVNLSLAKEKLFNIGLNKISGKFDLEKLAPLLEELSKMPDIEFELTGFDLPELSEILDRYNETKEDDFDAEKVAESIVEPISKRGDIIELGNHRIMCGDSSNPEDLKLLMGGHSVDMLDVDVPYNVSYMGGDRPNPNTRPKKSRQWEKIYSDDMPQPEYEAWMRKVFGNVKEHLKPGAAAYFWQGHRQIPPMYQILLEFGFHISSIICWLKESAAISYGDYSFRSEHALYGFLEGAPHYFAGNPGESNVWEIKRDPTKQYIHPTQKPVELAARAIRNSSKIGDIVLDCCIGGGGVLIAAESLGRRCFGMEISPKYCDAIVLRYIAYVGKDKVSEEIRKRYLKEGN
jgi:DNA modification methylase